MRICSLHRFLAGTVAFWCLLSGNLLAQRNTTPADWFSISANVDGGYRQTQFFARRHKTATLEGDSRLEFWLPPTKRQFSWGPYVRLSGVVSSKEEAWENAWLAGPGIGLQVFPFSLERFRARSSTVGRLFGPLRFFAERNAVKYWGEENRWRPDAQTRIGADYWKALNVNSHARPVWSELWMGLSWRSSNEFATDYRATTVAQAVRLGARRPARGRLSLVSPYVAAETSWSSVSASYWENRMLLGGGVRLAPSLVRRSGEESRRLTRLVFYAEYLRVASYFRADAPSNIPRFDGRAGVSITIGDWYR